MLNTSLLNPLDFIKVGLMALAFAMLIKWVGRKAGLTATPASPAQ